MKNDYILIEELEEERTKSGLWLPPNPHNRRAKVLNISIDDEDIKVGDTILKNIGKGTAIKVEGKEVEAIHRNNILAVIK